MYTSDLKLEDKSYIFMAITELNEETLDQICDLLENLQQVEKLKNKVIRIILDKKSEGMKGK